MVVFIIILSARFIFPIFGMDLDCFHSTYFEYFLFINYSYISVKCILGVVTIFKIVLNKTKQQKHKKIFYLIPFFLVSIMHICLIWFINTVDKTIPLFTIPRMSNGFVVWFSEMNLSPILNFLQIIDTFFWILYWTLYNEHIKKLNIILLNILTPLNSAILYFLIILQFVFIR